MTRIQLLIGLLIIGGVIVAASSYSTPRRLHIDPAPPQHQQTNSGMVKGQVLDMKGQSVSNAIVLALETEVGMAGKVPMAYTDRRGMFLFKRLPPGTYEISVEKREDGYPPTYLSFYSAGFVEVPRVTVYEQQTISDVVARLGPKATKLVGSIIDATTNEPIKNLQDVQITLRRVDNPEISYSTGPDIEGNFDILVPSAPFTLEVSAPGHEKWDRRSDELNDKRARTPRSASSDIQEITILLRKENASQN